MLKRLKRGIAFDEDDLALEVIAQVKPGGSFMMSPHTKKRMKTEALLTHLSDRDAREIWEKKGSLDTHARAMQRVLDILGRESTAPFPTEVEAASVSNSRIWFPPGWNYLKPLNTWALGVIGSVRIGYIGWDHRS